MRGDPHGRRVPTVNPTKRAPPFPTLLASSSLLVSSVVLFLIFVLPGPPGVLMLMPWLGFPPGAMADGAEVWRRDAYGFAVRPQHVQRFREYAKIYKVINSARVEMFCSLFVSGEVYNFFVWLFVRKRRRRGRTDGETSSTGWLIM